MRRSRLIAVATFSTLVVVSLLCFWQRRDEARRETIAAPDLPPLPSLAGFPAEFATRVHAVMNAVRKGDHPDDALAELGMIYQINGFSAEAEKIWLALRSRQPTEARWSYYLADLAQSSGNLEIWEARLQETVQLAPDYAPAELKLAELMIKQGRPEEARVHLTRCLVLSPNDSYAELGLARLAFLKGERSSIISQLENIVRRDPKFAAAHDWLAMEYEQAGDPDRASAHRLLSSQAGRFREAPDPWLEQMRGECFDPYRLKVFGAALLQTGRATESLPFFEKAVRLAPRDGAAHEALGDAYLRADRLPEARKTLEAGIAASPRTMLLYTRLSEVLRKLGQNREAVQMLEGGIRELPESAELRNELGLALEAAGQTEAASKAYAAATHLDANLAEPHLNLGLCLLTLGKNEAAGLSLRRALEIRPGEIKALLALAELDLANDALQSAGEYLQLARASRPDLPEIRDLLARWHLRRGAGAAQAGDVDQAKKIFLEGLRIAPDHGPLQGNLGVLYAQAGQYDEAINAFRKFLAVAPDDLTAHLYLGQALLASGHNDEARTVLTAGLKLAHQTGKVTEATRFDTLLEPLR
jgi:tetratricopeptide (TPR) repeat protein